ncbi:hypothetical protein ACO0SA_001035 [Hanseniaspora valbyensis]
MNALYNHANKQKQLLLKDIVKFETYLRNEHELSSNLNSIISTQGSIQTTLISLKKTLQKYKQQYENVIKQSKEDGDGEDDAEILKIKSRLDVLENEYTEFDTKVKGLKTQFEDLKKNNLFASSYNSVDNGNTSTLQNRGPRTSNVSENPLSSGMNDDKMHRNPFENATSGNNNNIFGANYYNDERSILNKTNKRLDQILEMGTNTLDDIMEQNQILSKVQTRMTSTLKTLGVSTDTINKVNKLVLKDKIRFYTSLVVFLILCWLTIYFLRR